MKSTTAPDMSVELENTFTAVSQKAFLSNSQNKQNFIDLLVVPLEADYHTVKIHRLLYFLLLAIYFMSLNRTTN